MPILALFLTVLVGVGFFWIDGQSVLIVFWSEIGFAALARFFGLVWCQVFLESLILAQDERWRRA
jgi:hypothetical protein